MTAPRPIDHIVLPTADLAVARARLSALGFTVAPDGIHPFGTANCCVYLADGTFLEPLAQGDVAAQAEASRRGNVFTARDIAYRYRRGDEGFSAVVFGTDDAMADHATFVEAGCSAGPILDFSRDFVDASGRNDIASFRLAFAADLRAPDFFFFTCQRVGVPNVDRSALQRHANGAVRLKTVVLAAQEPSDFAAFVGAAGKLEMGSSVDSVHMRAANASMELLTGQVLRDDFGGPAVVGRGLQARAIVFGVADLEATKTYLLSQNLGYAELRSRVIVQPAPGQGAIFAFEAL